MPEKVKEGITIEFKGETAQFDRDVNSMNKLIAQVRKDITALNKELKFDPQNVEILEKIFKDVQTEITACAEKIRLFEKSIEGTKNSKGEITDPQKWAALQAGLEKAKSEMVELTDRASRLRKMIDNIGQEKLIANLKQTSQSFRDIGTDIERAGKSLAVFSGAAVAGLGGAVKAATEFESAMAGVYKTVDETATTTYKDLEKTIREMALNLPSSTTEIASVMEMAGQLGVKADDLEKFTKVMIDLGNATNIDATSGAATLAQFYNITQSDLQSVDKFGAALTALGNNSATTEQEILDMSKAVAAAGFQIGLSNQDILGIATTLASVGLSAERAGSSISTILRKVDQAVGENSDTLEEWAKISGMSVEQFKNLWGTDVIKAIDSMIGGLANLDEETQNYYSVLSDVDISNIRQIDTITRLTNAHGKLQEYVAMANREWDKNEALVAEANRRYGTTESQFKVIRNQIREVGISLGQTLLPVIKNLLEAAKPLITQINNFVTANAAAISKMLAFAASISPVLIGIGSFSRTIGGLLGTLVKYIPMMKSASVITSGLAKVMVAGGSLGLVGAIGAVVLGLGGLVAAYNRANDKSIEFKSKMDSLNTSLEESAQRSEEEYQKRLLNVELMGKDIGNLDSWINAYKIYNERGIDTSYVLDKIRDHVDKLNEALGENAYTFNEETGELDLYGQAVESAKKSLEEMMGVMKQKAWLETHQNTYVEAMDNQATAYQELATAAQNYVNELSSINYDGISIPPELIQNMDQFFEDGVFNAAKFQDALRTSVPQQIIDKAWDFGGSIEMITGFVEEAYTTYQKSTQAATKTVAEAQEEIKKYLAVMNASPESIDIVLASLGALNAEFDGSNESLEYLLSVMEDIQAQSIANTGAENEYLKTVITNLKKEIQERNYVANKQKQNTNEVKRYRLDADGQIILSDNKVTQKKKENMNTLASENTKYTDTVIKNSNREAETRQKNSYVTKNTLSKNFWDYVKTVSESSTEVTKELKRLADQAGADMKSGLLTGINDAVKDGKLSWDQLVWHINHTTFADHTVYINGVYRAPAGMNAQTGLPGNNKWDTLNSGGFGDINLETKIYVNGNPDTKQIRAWGRQIAEVVNVELGKKVRA